MMKDPSLVAEKQKEREERQSGPYPDGDAGSRSRYKANRGRVLEMRLPIMWISYISSGLPSLS